MKSFASPRFRQALRWLRRLSIVGLVLVGVVWVIWFFLPKPDLFPTDLTFSRRVFDRDGGLLRITLTTDEKYRLPIRFADLSPSLITATLAKEDRRFFSHPGVDVRSLARAGWGVVSGQPLGGGSTLTMQYARLRWKLHTRSWWGKLVQIVRGAQLERHYGKREILEAYLTLAPYGGNVEGISAASLLWCGKTAADLTEREAICLSVIPQSPTLRRPRTGPNISLAGAQSRLFAQVHGQSSDLDAQFSLLPINRSTLAPHLSRRVLQEHPTINELRTTIDSRAQSIVESCIVDFRRRWEARGLANAAAILVHAPTREVRAYAGSASFDDAAIFGQVDGITARRSPGSALKPFIYALALDAGLIHPGTLLDDAPRAFSTYNPENSDRGFLGPVPAAEALRRSRNVPFVDLLARLPNGGLDRFLRESDVSLPRPPGAYGLSLALGGAEVSLEDLAALCAALATDGRAIPLQRTLHPTRPVSSRAVPRLSAAARYLTLAALRDRAPGSPAGLAWKTGTSHGFRDAWACGVQGEWVLCVWVGHFTGKSMPGLFARETAAPLLFETAIRLNLPPSKTEPPDTISTVSLCNTSGLFCSPQCPHATRAPFIGGVSPIGVCDVHREVLVNAQGRQVPASDQTARREIREFWPQHRLEQFRRAGLPKLPPPIPATGHDAALSSAGPRIVSPQSTLSYVFPAGDPDKRRIPLEAHASAGARRIHWFANSQYLGTSAPAEPFLWDALPGRWVFEATDDLGRSARVAISVSVLP
jgi:penicillin-binding protein 1C